MALDIYFREDIRNALDALDQTSKRTLALAEMYGMSAEVARLCHAVYTGALADMRVAFGLALPEPGTILKIPARFEGR